MSLASTQTSCLVYPSDVLSGISTHMILRSDPSPSPAIRTELTFADVSSEYVRLLRLPSSSEKTAHVFVLWEIVRSSPSYSERTYSPSLALSTFHPMRFASQIADIDSPRFCPVHCRLLTFGPVSPVWLTENVCIYLALLEGLNAFSSQRVSMTDFNDDVVLRIVWLAITR